MMAGHKPTVWISDRYSAQQKHGERHQTCLAHLARDTAFALEHGSDDLPFRFKLWLARAFDLAKAVANFAASTLARKKRELEKQLAALLAAPTGCELARELQAKIGRARDQLLTFCDYPGEVDVTNNTSERKLRPCVIQRKVMSGRRPLSRDFLRLCECLGCGHVYGLFCRKDRPAGPDVSSAAALRPITNSR
jgi:transposase